MKIHPRGATFGFLIGVALAATVVPVSIPGFITPAHAQVRTLPADFRQALEPYGQWVSHQRWGEVWVPEVPADWQPYSKGHWVYTEEWGWYWVADEEWGWIPYHYGRWIHDATARLGVGTRPRMGAGVGSMAPRRRGGRLGAAAAGRDRH